MLLALNGSTHISYIVCVDTLAVLRWSEMAKVSAIHENPSSQERKTPIPRILMPPSSSHLPSASFCFPALTALRHVAALLRKNFPEQRQKLCSPARARSLVCPCKVGDWSERERRQWREDLFTATDSDLDGDGLRSSHCRIFPRPRRNVT